MKKKLILASISFLFPIAIPAMEKGKRKRSSDEFMEMELVEQQPSSAEISKQSPFVPLPDEILVNILGNLITNDPDETLQNIRNAALTNQRFRNLINDKQFTKPLIQKLATNIKGKDELDIARALKNMPGVQNKEIQEWLAQRAQEIPLENQLINAAKTGNLSTAEELINKKVNVNALAKEPKITALIMATLSGFTEIIEKLLAAGADPNYQSRYISTALVIASSCGNSTIVEKLLAAGADPNLQDMGGDTALMYQATYRPEETPNSLAIVEQLLAKGAKINHQNMFKNTALMGAARTGKKAIVEKLLKAGANPNLTNYIGETALTEARASRNDDKEAIIKLLLEYGAK